MKIAEFSVKNSLLVNLLSIFIIVVGFIAMVQLRREAFPNIDFDTVTITTIYPGAPTEDVEKLVTTPIEKELRGISGIKKMTSSSEEGRSEIGIEIDPEARDKQKIIDDIKRAVDRVKGLPDEIDADPFIFELSADEFPIIEISVGGEYPEGQRREYAENLEDLILDIDGVSTVHRIAWRNPEIWVEVDPDKMQEYYVSLDEVIAALRLRNVTIPGGRLTVTDTEFNVRVTGEFRSPQEIEEVIIRANDAGNWLKIKDVARVQSAYKDPVTIPKIDGKRAVSMVVVKSKQGDVIDVVSRVREVIDEFSAGLPDGMGVKITNDFSYYVQRRLNVLKTNGIIGLILVLAVLFIFLDPLPALMTAIGLPIALFTTFGVMLWMGTSINLVTMLGLIIVLGMLVDDGIIVSENVYRYIEQGMPPKEAAVKGTSEVIAPVTVTILTTFAAFSPLLFMDDLIGKFIRFIPIVVMVALAASLLEAFVILPSHLSDFVRIKKDSLLKGRVRKDKPWFRKLIHAYTRTLNWSLDHRYKFFVGLIALFCLTVFTAMRMRIVMFTGEGVEQFYVRAESEKGTSLEKMEEMMRPVEELIASLPSSELDAYRTYVGEISQERNFDPNAKRGSHLAQIRVFLTPAQKRARSPAEIVESLRPRLERIEGFEKLYFDLPREGPPVGRPIEIGIKGDDFGTLQEIADVFIARLENIAGVSDVSSSYQYGRKQLKVVVDEERARKYHLTISQIASTVRSVFDGAIATQIKPVRAEEEIDVVVRFPQQARDDIQAFEKIRVRNEPGNLVPLLSVAEIRELDGIYRIDHLDGKRVVYVFAQVDEKNATSLGVNQMLAAEFKDLPQQYRGYSVVYGGEYEDQIRTFRNLLKSFAIAFFLIFIILATMFNSLIQPFVVMLSIPFGIIGVVFAFLLHGMPLSFFAFIGVVGLSGVVVNGSVVFVDFVNKLRKSGKSRRESLVEAGQIRLRPVLMTSITTIAGLASVAYGIGGGDPFLKPMALAIVWGLFFAVGLTLVVTPCIYAIIDDFFEKIFHRATVKKNNHAFAPPAV